MAKSEFAYSKAWRGGQNLNPVVDSVLNNISDFFNIKRPKRRFLWRRSRWADWWTRLTQV